MGKNIEKSLPLICFSDISQLQIFPSMFSNETDIKFDMLFSLQYTNSPACISVAFVYMFSFVFLERFNSIHSDKVKLEMEMHKVRL